MLGLTNEKKYEKNYLCFDFFVLSYYLYIELGQKPRPRQIYRYVDIQMPTDGAEGLKRWG